MKLHLVEGETLLSGDIVLVKNDTFIGWAIGHSFWCDSPIKNWLTHKNRPSGHNGIIGYNRNKEMCIFEAQFQGFVATPFSTYEKLMEKNETEIKIIRPISQEKALDEKERTEADDWMNMRLGLPYDFSAIIMLAWTTLLRMPRIFNLDMGSHLWCTEAVQDLYSHFSKNWIYKKHPTPFTIEKRYMQGRCKIIAECMW